MKRFVVGSSSSQEGTSSITLEGPPPAKRRGVTTKTIDRWIQTNDKVLNTTTWLTYEVVDREFVACMKCRVCIRFKERIVTCRNFNSAFIDGSTNLRTSAFKDHASSDMHKRAMTLFNKASGKKATEYAPIVRALLTMDEGTKRRVIKKFEVAYFLSKENMAFSKMGAICELEELHQVDLGQGYKNRQACGVFVEYIAKEMRLSLAHTLENCNFFSVQGDGSTDCGNVEEELFLAHYFNPYTEDGKVSVCSKVLSVRQPPSGDAAGLFESLQRAMDHVNVMVQV